MASSTLKLRMPAQFPSNVVGAGGIQVQKANGRWTVSPNFGALAPLGSVANPTVKEVWVYDPVANTYNVVTLAVIVAPGIQTLTGTSGNQPAAAPNTTLIVNPSAAFTLTLVPASAAPGTMFYIKTVAAFAVASASSNVVPRAGGSAGTAILSGTAGNWALLQSDGVNWNIIAGS